MSCLICGKETESILCENCFQITELLHNKYDLQEMITLFSIVLGDKMVEDVIEDVGGTKDEMPSTETH